MNTKARKQQNKKRNHTTIKTMKNTNLMAASMNILKRIVNALYVNSVEEK